MKKKLRTVLEITESHIKFLQSKMVRGKRDIITCECMPYAEGSGPDIVRGLTQLAKTYTIDKDDFILVVPRKSIILKRFDLPSDKPQEIKKMINLQLMSQIPYTLDDIEYSQYVAHQEGGDRTEILLAVMHKDIIQTNLRQLKEADMPAPKWSISSMGVLGWEMIQQRISKKENRKGLSFVLINIDAGHCEICFLSGSSLRHSRNLPFGSEDLKQDAIKLFIRNIQLSLSAYRNEKIGPPMEQVVIISEVFEAQLLKESIEKEHALPVTVVSSLEHIDISKHKGLRSLDLQQSLSLAVPIGFSATDTARLWNLTPKEIKEGRSAKRHRTQVIKFFILLSIVSALIVSFWVSELFQKKMLLKKWQDHRLTAQKEVQQAQRKSMLVELFRDKVLQRIFILDVMLEIHRILPPSVALENIKLDSANKLTLQGSAENSSDINRFQSDLFQTEKFAEVNLEFQKKRKIRNKSQTIFKLSAQIQEKQE